MIKKEHLVKIKEFNVVTISSYSKYRRKTHTVSRGIFTNKKAVKTVLNEVQRGRAHYSKHQHTTHPVFKVILN